MGEVRMLKDQKAMGENKEFRENPTINETSQERKDASLFASRRQDFASGPAGNLFEGQVNSFIYRSLH
jgi:hypothetical protein